MHGGTIYMKHNHLKKSIYSPPKLSKENRRNRDYRYIIRYGYFKEMEMYQIKDCIAQAVSDGAPNDAVYKVGGFTDGKYLPSKWVCLWELSRGSDIYNAVTTPIEEEISGINFDKVFS